MSRGAETRTAGCLLFDYGGTLDSDGIAWKERFHTLYRADGLSIAPADFDRLFYRADDALAGTILVDAALEQTVQLLVANLEAGLAQWLFADPGRARRIGGAFLGTTYAMVERNRPALESLQSRYRLGIVSNFYGNLLSVCRGLGISSLFDAVVDSEQLGVRKPDPAIFRAAMEPLGALPGSTFMIGDSLRRDREGARRCGLGFIWIAPAEAHAEAEADHPAIERLDRLEEVLP